MFIAELTSRMQRIEGVESLYVCLEPGGIRITTIVEGDWFDREVEDKVYEQEYELLGKYNDLPVTFDCTPEGLVQQGALPADAIRLF